MNILFVSAVLPYPLTSGGQVRMYNLLKRLSQKHAITLVSFIREEKERLYKKDLDFCEDVVMVMRGKAWQPKYVAKALIGSYPFLLATYDNALMRRTLKDRMAREKFDLLHLEPFYVWPSVPETSLPIVVSEHNVEYAVYKTFVRERAALLGPFLSLDVAKIKRWEEAVWRKASAVTAVSPQDASLITRASGKPVSVVPNGVDLSQFSFSSERPKRMGPLLLFTGDFRWFPNKDALRRLLTDIWPKVTIRFPQSTLRIVGRHIAASTADQIRNAGAQLQEDVADIGEEYRNADVLAAPHAIAGGTKFKMLEAMASGLPIVTTKEGMAGLAALAQTHYLEASSTVEFVAQVARIWENIQVRNNLTRNARQLVEQHYSWENIATTLEAVWRRYEH